MTETMYVVIPCYNEEQMLPITAEALIKKFDELKAEGRIAQNSKVMFVDDGSKDKNVGDNTEAPRSKPCFHRS